MIALIRISVMAALALCVSTMTAAAQSTNWNAVGQLAIAGEGRCIATLIAPDRVLTSAKCFYAMAGGNGVALDDITFTAQRQDGRGTLERTAAGVLIHPIFPSSDPDTPEFINSDIAIVSLSADIRSTNLRALTIPHHFSARMDGTLLLQTGLEADARGLECPVTAARDDIYILDCVSDTPMLGAPVFQMEGREARLVSVVSQIISLDGRRVAVGPMLEERVDFMNTVLSRGLAGSTHIGALHGDRPTGDPNETGARFVRP